MSNCLTQISKTYLSPDSFFTAYWYTFGKIRFQGIYHLTCVLNSIIPFTKENQCLFKMSCCAAFCSIQIKPPFRLRSQNTLMGTGNVIQLQSACLSMCEALGGIPRTSRKEGKAKKEEKFQNTLASQCKYDSKDLSNSNVQ